VLGVFAAARDVTARRKAEDELAEQRQRELERLAELEKFQKLTVGRELKMIELKKEIEELKRENEDLKSRLTDERDDRDGRWQRINLSRKRIERKYGLASSTAPRRLLRGEWEQP